MQRRLSKTLEDVRMRLHRHHPILSRIGPWLRSRLRATEQKFSLENQWSAHEEALSLCNAEKLAQTIYFLNRDLAFMKEVSELAKDQKLARALHRLINYYHKITC